MSLFRRYHLFFIVGSDANQENVGIMRSESRMLRDIEAALVRCPLKPRSERYVVYVPGSIIIGIYSEKDTADETASHWRAMNPDATIIVVDRGTSTA